MVPSLGAVKLEVRDLGKGDKRTFRGKVFKGSHGKTRPRKPKKASKKPA